MIWSCLDVILSQFWFLLIAYHSFTVSSSTSASTSAYFIRFISCPKYFSCHHNPSWQHYLLRKILQSFISKILPFPLLFIPYFSPTSPKVILMVIRKPTWIDLTQLKHCQITWPKHVIVCFPFLSFPCFPFPCCDVMWCAVFSTQSPWQ